MVVADRAKHARIGRVARLPLPAGGETELLEQDPRELLRRAELELLAGQLERRRLELLDALREPGGDLAHPVGVDPDPGVLHVRQDRGQRQLDLVVQRLHPPLAEPPAQLRREHARRLGAPHERGGLLLGRRVGHELEPVLAREVVELVPRPARIDEVGRDAACRPPAPGRAGALFASWAATSAPCSSRAASPTPASTTSTASDRATASLPSASATPTSSRYWPDTQLLGRPSRHATVSRSIYDLGRGQRLVERVDAAQKPVGTRSGGRSP